MSKKKVLIGILVVVTITAGYLFWRWQDYLIRIAEVSILTDTTEYARGDTLRIKIQNKSGKNICFSSCYPYHLEKKDGKWKSYPYGECQRVDIVENCVEPGQEKAFEIELDLVKEGSHRILVPVCYNCQIGDPFREDKRFYSNKFWIKERVEGVIIITDKTEYEVGEMVKITIRNNLDKDVCYFTPTGSDCYRTPYDV